MVRSKYKMEKSLNITKGCFPYGKVLAEKFCLGCSIESLRVLNKLPSTNKDMFTSLLCSLETLKVYAMYPICLYNRTVYIDRLKRQITQHRRENQPLTHTGI